MDTTTRTTVALRLVQLLSLAFVITLSGCSTDPAPPELVYGDTYTTELLPRSTAPQECNEVPQTDTEPLSDTAVLCNWLERHQVVAAGTLSDIEAVFEGPYVNGAGAVVNECEYAGYRLYGTFSVIAPLHGELPQGESIRVLLDEHFLALTADHATGVVEARLPELLDAQLVLRLRQFDSDAELWLQEAAVLVVIPGDGGGYVVGSDEPLCPGHDHLPWIGATIESVRAVASAHCTGSDSRLVDIERSYALCGDDYELPDPCRETSDCDAGYTCVDDQCIVL